MKQLAKAIIKVMAAVKGIEKNMTIGKGQNSYQGDKDKEVKLAFNEAMTKHGLCILPISIEPDTKVERWVEETQWGPRQKQSIFCAVKTKYLLMHESGESIEICGYGHGIDPQDKAAGKAQTYALKNALLYTFMTPVGAIEDTDTTHSDTIPVPQPKPKKAPAKKAIKDEQIQTIIDWAKDKGYKIKNVESAYKLSPVQKATILKAIQ
jgi:hypothetical protein